MKTKVPFNQSRTSEKRQIGLFHSLKSLTTLFLCCLLIFSSNIYAQVAPVNPPKGGFAIDGGLLANTPTSPSPFAANQGDWVFGPGGTGDSVLRYNGTPFNSATSGLKRDLFNNGNDSIFTTGSKFNDYIGSLHWFQSTAPNKNDINNAMYHVATNPATTGPGAGDQWAFIAGDRLSTSGTSYIDFEFLQGTVTINSNGTFSGSGPAGGRTVGDIIISMEYTNGGAIATVIIYRWKQSGSTYFWDSTGSSQITNAFARTNAGNESVPFGAFGSTTYQPFAFVEAAIDITQLIAAGGANCAGLSIKTLWIKTKASASSTAALKDFITPIPVSFNFGSVTLNKQGPLCVNASPVTLSGSPSGGTFSGTGVSGNQFNPSVAGPGEWVITYSVQLSATCTKQDTIHILVNGLPTVFTLSGNSICASAPNTGTITLSNSQSGVSYQLKKASDNSNVGSSQSGTGSALQFTGLPAGVDFYVLATGAAPTNCTSQTTNAHVTEVANPTVFSLSGNSICSSAPNTGVITLSSSQSGVNYQLKKASDNSNVGSSQTGTGSALQFTGLAASVDFYVLATGGAPTNCTSQTANAHVTEVANPSVFTLSGNSICASAPNTGIITLSSSQTGVTYQLKKASDNSNVGSSQNGNGSALQFTGLAAGVDFYVLATGGTPTNCTSQTGNAHVTEVANPTVFNLSGNSICSSAPNTGVLTLSSSQTSVTYQLKKASDNSDVGSSQSGTGSALQFTGLPAGVDFYVLATGGSPTNCTSQTANAHVIEVANPTVFNLSGNAICSSNPNTGVITLSSSEMGVSYQLKKASDNSNVGTSQAGTGSALQFTGLSAGVDFYVLATGGAPTNCTSQTANASVTQNQNPDAPTSHIVTPLCTDATMTVQVDNPVSGITYTLSQTGHQPVSITANGSPVNPVIFTGLQFGIGYSIIATNGATGCSSNADVCGGSSFAGPSSQQTLSSKAESSKPSVLAAPNPFNDRIRFSFQSPVSGKGSLELYTLMGQKVATVFQGYVQKGQAQTVMYNVPASQRTNLIYVFRIGNQKVSSMLIGSK